VWRIQPVAACTLQHVWVRGMCVCQECALISTRRRLQEPHEKAVVCEQGWLHWLKNVSVCLSVCLYVLSGSAYEQCDEDTARHANGNGDTLVNKQRSARAR
jgi:hypothetical protein